MFASVPIDELCAEETLEEPQSLVEEMLLRGRYSLLLRHQVIGNLTADEVFQVRARLAEGMCLVPGGPVALMSADDLAHADERSGIPGSTVLRVEAFYLDRYPVTNRRVSPVRRPRRLRADGHLGR